MCVFITGLKEDTPFPSFTPRHAKARPSRAQGGEPGCCEDARMRGWPFMLLIVEETPGFLKILLQHGELKQCFFLAPRVSESSLSEHGNHGIQSDLSQTYSRTLCTKPLTLIFLLMAVQFNTT